MRLLRPDGDRLQHPLVGDRGGVAFALKLELGLIDAARHVGGEHQQQIDLFGGLRAWWRQERRGAERKQDEQRIETHGAWAHLHTGS